MGFLDKFEKGVENVTNRAMSRFSDDIEPIEIASKLRETMDKRAASFARDRSVVPNIFRIHLTPPSIERITAWGQDEMVRQMEEVATSHAADQGYSFVGPVEVSFLVNNNPNAPAIEIESSTRRGAAAPAASATATPAHPIVDINGQRYLLTGPVTVIGRGSEADIIVDDSGVSQGQRVDAVTLVDGNTLTIGRTQILFWDGTQNSGVNG